MLFIRVSHDKQAASWVVLAAHINVAESGCFSC